MASGVPGRSDVSEEGRAITTHLCVVTDTYPPEINGVA